MISQDPGGGAAVAPTSHQSISVYTHTHSSEKRENTSVLSTVPRRMLLSKCSLKETIGRIKEQRITSTRVKPDWFNTDTHYYRKANYTDT